MAKRKYKSQLKKLINEECELIYETNLEDCKKWFRILNHECFNNELPPVDDIDIRWRRNSIHAHYAYEIDDEMPDYKWCQLQMNKRYKSKKFFVEVLAHEMVHHWQYINRQSVNHGNSFKNWSEKLLKKGLKI